MSSSIEDYRKAFFGNTAEELAALAVATAEGKSFADVIALLDTGNFVVSREGGSATNWSTVGATNQTVPAELKIQFGGWQSVSILAGASGSAAITFPVAFANVPIVFTQHSDPTGVILWSSRADAVTASGFTIVAVNLHTITAGTARVMWMAVGE